MFKPIDEGDEGRLIASVVRDKKERRRYHLYGESDERLLSVHEDIMIQHRLLKGRRLSSEQLHEIEREDQLYHGYALALSYLGAKPRSRKQISSYLGRKEMNEETIESVVKRLEHERLVDDEQYAEQFAASRLRNQLKGSRMIKHELRQIGISDKTASEAVSQLDPGSELAAAKELVRKKSRSLKGDSREQSRKLTAFLLRRGFSGAIAREALQSANLGHVDPYEDGEDGVLLDN